MSVRQRGNILYIDFSCRLPNGKKVRCVESTGLRPSRKNWKTVENKNKRIKFDLKLGTFDYLEYFPNGSKARFFRKPSDQKLEDYWDSWLVTKSMRASTQRGWEGVYKNHIGPNLGQYRLSEIDEHEILLFRNKMVAQGLKASTVNDRIVKLLCMVLLQAKRDGILDEYPCQYIKRLKTIHADVDPYSFDEMIHLLTSLEKQQMYDWHDLFYIWFRTGLRPGEMYALKWDNIDYPNSKLLVRETRLKGVDGPPKTEHSIRDVDLRSRTIQALRRQETRTKSQRDYVFLTSRGKPLNDQYLGQKLKWCLKLAGLRYRAPKEFRHTFASLHIAAGENISWVSAMLGHATVETTLKYYNRFVPNLTHDDGAVLEGFMKVAYENNRSGESKS